MSIEFTLPGELLRDVTTILGKFVSTDPDRGELTRIVIDSVGSLLRFAATDGYKMVLISLTREADDEFDDVAIRAVDFAALVDFVTKTADNRRRHLDSDVRVHIEGDHRPSSQRRIKMIAEDGSADAARYGAVYKAHEYDADIRQLTVAKARSMLDGFAGGDVPDDGVGLNPIYFTQVMEAAFLWGGTTAPIRMTQRDPAKALHIVSRRGGVGTAEMCLMPVWRV